MAAVGPKKKKVNGTIRKSDLAAIFRRAEELLGAEVTVGEPLPATGELGEALGEWLGGYLRGAADEAHSDIQTGERRVRVRARRLGTLGTRRGAVVALDDVTDELRAERVLAWGEMARQVAHEVKNPLTPIKLSIQHVRRAWSDQHPDFDRILVRNADAMLGEIDRLAASALQPASEILVVSLESEFARRVRLVEWVVAHDCRVLRQMSGELLPEGRGLGLKRLVPPEAVVEPVAVVLPPTGTREAEHGEDYPDVVTRGDVEDPDQVLQIRPWNPVESIGISHQEVAARPTPVRG